MMKSLSCMLVLAVAFCEAGSCAEEKKRKEEPAVKVAKKDVAIEITKLANTRELYLTAFMSAFEPHVELLQASGKASAEQAAKIKKEAKVFANGIYDDPDFVKSIAAVYKKEFTDKELSSLLDFYKTDVGKKVLEKMPKVLQASAKVGETLALKHQPGFQKKVQAIMTGTDETSAPPADGAKPEK